MIWFPLLPVVVYADLKIPGSIPLDAARYFLLNLLK
jgi:hypothetical protein